MDTIANSRSVRIVSMKPMARGEKIMTAMRNVTHVKSNVLIDNSGGIDMTYEEKRLRLQISQLFAEIGE